MSTTDKLGAGLVLLALALFILNRSYKRLEKQVLAIERELSEVHSQLIDLQAMSSERSVVQQYGLSSLDTARAKMVMELPIERFKKE